MTTRNEEVQPKRALVVVSSLVVALVAIAATCGDIGAAGGAKAASGTHRGAGWLAVMPSRLIASDAIGP